MRRHAADGAAIVSPPRQPAGCSTGCAATTSGWTARAIRTASTDREIPLAARIIAVADTYDAMTTSRPYRAGLPPERAAAEILGAPAASSARAWWPPSARSSRPAGSRAWRRRAEGDPARSVSEPLSPRHLGDPAPVEAAMSCGAEVSHPDPMLRLRYIVNGEDRVVPLAGGQGPPGAGERQRRRPLGRLRLPLPRRDAAARAAAGRSTT